MMTTTMANAKDDDKTNNNNKSSFHCSRNKPLWYDEHNQQDDECLHP